MRKAKRRVAAKRGAGRSQDAIALLKADHRQVEQWFEQFEGTRSTSRKGELAAKICAALTVHTKIEEEIFYPAFLEATEDKDIHHEAEVEHDGAKKLIAVIEANSFGRWIAIRSAPSAPIDTPMRWHASGQLPAWN